MKIVKRLALVLVVAFAALLPRHADRTMPRTRCRAQSDAVWGAGVAVTDFFVALANG